MPATVQHDEWCDGYVFAHIAEVNHTRVGSRGGLFQAACRTCEWTGQLYGKDARDVAKREAKGHVEEVPCTGQCVA